MTWFCDTDAPKFYVWSEPVARKRHRCCECCAPIEPGEKHFRYSGKWEGSVMTGRQHLLCMEACMLIRDEFESGDCIGFGGLMDWYHEYRLGLRTGRTEAMKRLRSLLAQIRRRERGAA